MSDFRTFLFKLSQHLGHRFTPRLNVPTATTRKIGTKPLKGALIGLGVIGREHVSAMQACALTQLTAVCARRGLEADHELGRGVEIYSNLDDLLRTGTFDFVTVATPHPSHYDIVKKALETGKHVLCEKPLCVSAADARRLGRLAKDQGLVLKAAFHTRYAPVIRFVKSYLESGALGRVLRCEMSENYWRAKNYYADSSWRGAWATEGGGVLINQAPHILDRYLYLFGAPTSVMGQCETLLHDIEVEDTITAILRQSDGMHGLIRVSTAEAPWKSRLYISGDKGTLEVENGMVKQAQYSGSLSDGYLNNANRTPDQEITFSQARVQPTDEVSELHGLYADFASRIRAGTVLDDTETGADQVALSNALLLSHHQRKWVDYPVDLDEVSALLTELGAPIGDASD